MCEPTLYDCRRKIMNYEEFKKYKDITDNKFVKKFQTSDGNCFYIEPAFYTQLMGLQGRYPENFKLVINEIYKQVEAHKLMAFVYDFESPFLDYKDAVLREFTDVTDSVKVFFEDKSRGSDYGD